MDSNEFDRIVAEKDAEIGRLRKRIVHLKEQRTLMEHKVIACGVAATHPDAQLAASGVYKTEWNSQQLEEVIALRTRAEAAEAEVARLNKEVESLQCEVCCPTCGGCGTEGCCSPNNCELVKCKYPHNVETWKENMQHIETLTAQLAAANERVREAYAILCQLENVYRRQSTESVGSFGVSQEVHSLLKRAMDTLNGMEDD